MLSVSGCGRRQGKGLMGQSRKGLQDTPTNLDIPCRQWVILEGSARGERQIGHTFKKDNFEDIVSHSALRPKM